MNMRRILTMMCLATPTLALQYPLSLAAAARLLEVRYPSPKSTVRAAYRKKAATNHPDVSLHANAAADFMRITAAYEYLLQFSITEPAVAAPPPQSAHSPAAEAQQASSAHEAEEAYANARSASAAGATRNDPQRFERRVASWREYWQVTFQVVALTSEVNAPLGARFRSQCTHVGY